MQEILKKHADKFRFLIVGSTNTVLDFGILFSLTIFLNIPTTFVAFLFSFFANKKYTFKSTSQNLKKQFLLFAAITLFGLWVIQTIIIAIITPIFISFGLNKSLALLISKLAATVVSLVWNYVLYSRIVFKDAKNSSD